MILPDPAPSPVTQLVTITDPVAVDDRPLFALLELRSRPQWTNPSTDRCLEAERVRAVREYRPAERRRPIVHERQVRRRVPGIDRLPARKRSRCPEDVSP